MCVCVCVCVCMCACAGVCEREAYIERSFNQLDEIGMNQAMYGWVILVHRMILYVYFEHVLIVCVRVLSCPHFSQIHA